MKSLIVCKLPRAGLGNQLFPLMKAVVKSRLTGLPLLVTNYRQFSIGPYLRGEKSKRQYWGYFNFERSYLGDLISTFQLRSYRGYHTVQEPPLTADGSPVIDKTMYVYAATAHWADYFYELKDYRELVVKSFFEILQSGILQMVASKNAPCIGVHIRMGDFRKLAAGENFAALGTVRTPEEYFINTINTIRKIAGSNLPVTVFTDGYRHEFAELFNLPAVTMMEGNLDIVDLVLLSKSKVIIASATSTFSYWAGFLSEAALIMHPDHIHASIRPPEFNKVWFEGSLSHQHLDPLLIANIQQIAH